MKIRVYNAFEQRPRQRGEKQNKKNERKTKQTEQPANARKQKPFLLETFF